LPAPSGPEATPDCKRGQLQREGIGVDFPDTWWRGAIIVLLLGLGVAMTVAWGWTAAVIYGFFLAVALFNALFFILWAPIAQRGGGWYYERQLRGRLKPSGIPDRGT
jgi:hypothetical protein